MSLVTLLPPIGSTAVKNGEPSMNSARSIVPAPKSATATPSSRSVSVSTAYAEAMRLPRRARRCGCRRAARTSRGSGPPLPSRGRWRLDLQPHRAHAQRILDTLLAVDDEAAWQDVEHLAVRRDGDRARDLCRAIDVLPGHLTACAADGHRATRVLRLDVCAANRDDGRLDPIARQSLGGLTGEPDGVDRLVDVDHHGLLQPGRRLRALADDSHLPVSRHLADQRHDLVRAHVERDEDCFSFHPTFWPNAADAGVGVARGVSIGLTGSYVPHRSSSGARYARAGWPHRDRAASAGTAPGAE